MSKSSNDNNDDSSSDMKPSASLTSPIADTTFTRHPTDDPRNFIVNFPIKLHYMLNEIHQDGFTDIISWKDNGKCFSIHQPNLFVKTILNQ